MQPSDVRNLYKHKGFHIKLIGLFWKWGESFWKQWGKSILCVCMLQ